MSILKRGKSYTIRFRPFGELINITTSARTKQEVKLLEAAILTACRAGDYRGLDPVAREACVRMFKNQGWEIPPDLAGRESVTKELTLWDSCEIFLNYPTIKDSKSKWRYIYCLTNLVKKIGRNTPVRGLWIPQIRRFMADRLSEGASPATINWERSTLSKLFGVLIELQYVDANPARLVKRLPTKSRERQAYVSYHDAQKIAATGPRWFRHFFWVIYYTGMRRSEAFYLTRSQVDLTGRMIRLGADATKEGHAKRVPLRREAVAVLEEAMRVTSLETDRVFLLQDAEGVRPPSIESVKNPWRRATRALDVEPKPTLHDIRHTWRANARRSKVDPVIAERILGHAGRELDVSERYGLISDEELIEAVDSMTFDHGESRIWGVGT